MQLFSKDELRDILISIVVLTLIFAFKPFPTIGIDYENLLSYAFIVIIAFFLHQMAQKLTARRFNCLAIYKIWPSGIFFGIVLMLVGIKFAALGAAIVYPYLFGRWGYRRKGLTTNESGIVALSGPLINLILAIILFSLFSPFSGTSGSFFKTFTTVNVWFAFFNLLPIPPLDGSKIMQWRIWVWGVMIALSGLLIYLILF